MLPDLWNCWDVNERGLTWLLFNAGVWAWLPLGDVELPAGPLGRRASSDARINRFVVPVSFVLPLLAEQTTTTRLP